MSAEWAQIVEISNFEQDSVLNHVIFCFNLFIAFVSLKVRCMQKRSYINLFMFYCSFRYVIVITSYEIVFAYLLELYSHDVLFFVLFFWIFNVPFIHIENKTERKKDRQRKWYKANKLSFLLMITLTLFVTYMCIVYICHASLCFTYKPKSLKSIKILE